MSGTKHAFELCAHLVNETYGELASRIFTILLRRGRLPISALTKHTRITSRALRHGLAVLIQQNLIYHISGKGEPTYYEANPDAAYALVRSGKIMNFIEDRYGSLAREVVKIILLLGHARISDVIAQYKSQKKEEAKLAKKAREEEIRRLEEEREEEEESEHPQTNGTKPHTGTNGVGAHVSIPTATDGQLNTILARLCEDGFIEKVVKGMFQSPADIFNQLEKETIREQYQGQVKGGKQQEAVDKIVCAEMRKMRSHGPDWRPQVTRKRPANGEHLNGNDRSGKRRRLSHNGFAADDSAHNIDDNYEDDGGSLDPSLVVRINHKKCQVVLRNVRLVELAELTIGKTTSLIYAVLLDKLENQLNRCKKDPIVDKVDDDAILPTISTTILSKALEDTDIDASDGIGKARAVEAEANGRNKNGHASGDNEDDDPFDEEPVPARPEKRRNLGSARENHILYVGSHLDLLQKEGLIHLESNDGQGTYSVHFEEIMKRIQELELFQIIEENFGIEGHRLARLLHKLGRLDEKALEKRALMQQKDVRTKLAAMQLAGFIEIQEVPKDLANRVNNRTIFLCFIDIERLSDVLLDKIYQSMSRLLQRLVLERRTYTSVLEVTERSDLRHAAPEHYLEPKQLEQLKKYQRKEELLMEQIGRLDSLVGIFRDF
ncbi:hypothetical protein HYALB_00004166 [Hymenoscyphus albidus]|uniref:DNA-directed RNA polymerase III subunit RPC3 n=1 Tax=Hymenoscyphus albidus TaxID=595503 RepID=A0A9N9M2C2_9HELO|nr:hypothetical protein HYALB_00004166 [Hymenoscyphus albidus]